MPRIHAHVLNSLNRLNTANIGTSSAIGASITARREGVDLAAQSVRLVWGAGKVVVEGELVSLATNQVTIYGDTDLNLKAGDTFNAEGKRCEVIRGAAPAGYAGIGRIAIAEERQ